MRLLCKAHCTKQEYEDVKEKLEEIPDLQLTTFGTTITAIYEPGSDEPIGKVNEILNQVTTIIEPVEEHGISMLLDA